MPTSRKRTLGERVQSLEDWFAEAHADPQPAAIVHSEPDPAQDARRRLRASLDASRDIVMHRILDQITAELAQESPSSLRVANFAAAYGALSRSY